MRKLRFEAGIIGLLVLAACLAGIGYAKSADGALGGIVLNAKGAPVSAAEILWQSADGKAPHAARTNASGRFRIPGLRQGLYDVRAQAGEMTSEWEHNVVVRPGGDTSLTLRLSHRIPRPAASESSGGTQTY